MALPSVAGDDLSRSKVCAPSDMHKIDEIATRDRVGMKCTNIPEGLLAMLAYLGQVDVFGTVSLRGKPLLLTGRKASLGSECGYLALPFVRASLLA